MVGPHACLTAGMAPGQVMASDPVVRIGDRCVIGRGSHIVGHWSIEIGDDIQTGPYVYVTDQNHTYVDPDEPVGRQWPVEAPVKIGSGSWLGAERRRAAGGDDRRARRRGRRGGRPGGDPGPLRRRRRAGPDRSPLAARPRLGRRAGCRRGGMATAARPGRGWRTVVADVAGTAAPAEAGGPAALLVTVSGPDRPGISVRIFEQLAWLGLELVDVEQVQVHGRLLLCLELGTTHMAADAVRQELDGALGGLRDGAGELQVSVAELGPGRENGRGLRPSGDGARPPARGRGDGRDLRSDRRRRRERRPDRPPFVVPGDELRAGGVGRRRGPAPPGAGGRGGPPVGRPGGPAGRPAPAGEAPDRPRRRLDAAPGRGHRPAGGAGGLRGRGGGGHRGGDGRGGRLRRRDARAAGPAGRARRGGARGGGRRARARRRGRGR